MFFCPFSQFFTAFPFCSTVLLLLCHANTQNPSILIFSSTQIRLQDGVSVPLICLWLGNHLQGIAKQEQCLFYLFIFLKSPTVSLFFVYIWQIFALYILSILLFAYGRGTNYDSNDLWQSGLFRNKEQFFKITNSSNQPNRQNNTKQNLTKIFR